MLLYAVVPADAIASERRGLLGRPARDDPGRSSPPLSPRSPLSALTPRATSRVHLPRSSATWQRRFPCSRYVSPPCCLHDRQFWQSFKPTKPRGVGDSLSSTGWLRWSSVPRRQKSIMNSESASDGAGTTYLVNRAAAIHRREALVNEISELVRTWTREIKVLPPQHEVRLACLVANAEVAQLRDAVTTWQQARSGRQAVVSGPWPVFSFVGDQEAVSR